MQAWYGSSYRFGVFDWREPAAFWRGTLSYRNTKSSVRQPAIQSVRRIKNVPSFFIDGKNGKNSVGKVGWISEKGRETRTVRGPKEFCPLDSAHWIVNSVRRPGGMTQWVSRSADCSPVTLFQVP